MRKSIVTVLCLFLSISTYAQIIEKKIDQIFNDWNTENHPGGVLAVQRKSDRAFFKAYGLANIKYNIATSEETLFNIASVSKQFTAMGIVLLQLEGKLSFDDDIRNYLPELHPFEKKISIRHLLHHTSGIRSTPEIFGLAGWREGDAITTEDDFRYLCKQTSLNFEPGSKFMYSNSGYVLLAKIIERVSRQNFNIWMKENVFVPLKMNNTFVDETNSNVHPAVATPYMEYAPKQFMIGENSSLDIGASNIYTTVGDLFIWMSNFNTPSEGFKKAFKVLLTTDTLSDGEVHPYAFGVFKDDFSGNKRIQHTGGIPGFLSYAAYYPEEELTVILLTNFTSRSVDEKYTKLSQLFLSDKSEKGKTSDLRKEIPLDTAKAKTFTGDYWNTKENYPRKVYYTNDTLWYQRQNGSKSPLIQIDDFTYKIGGLKALVTIQFKEGSIKQMLVKDGDKPIQIFEEYDSSPLNEDEIKEYTGTFYSNELETSYTISILNAQLVGYHSRHGEFPIEILKRDITDWSGFATVTYIRNQQKIITGVRVDINRAENILFEKIKD